MTIPIFEKVRRGESAYTIQAKGYRKLLLTMLRENTPLTRRAIARKAAIKEPTALTYLDRCVKEGLVTHDKIQVDDHQVRIEYELSAEGTFLALVVTSTEGLKAGVDYERILEKAFAVEEPDSPITKFSKSVYLNMVRARHISELLDTVGTPLSTLYAAGGEAPYWFFFVMAGLLGRIQAFQYPQRRSMVLSSTSEAFMSLPEREKIIVGAYLKHKIEDMFYDNSIMLDDQVMQSSLVKSRLDPENVIVPLTCKKCDYKTNEHKIPMTTIFSIDIKCPKCESTSIIIGTVEKSPELIGTTAGIVDKEEAKLFKVEDEITFRNRP